VPEDLTQLDVAAAVTAGAKAVRITTPCRLSAGAPSATLTLIRVLREASSDGVPVSWRAELDAGFDTTLLVHLPPPANGDADPALAAWRRQHRPGLCYYRLGPDFVFIKDVRRAGAAARFRLGGATASFRALEPLVRVESLDPPARDLLEDLEREGLALRLGALATLLPSRMRRWPVPALEV
jgi:Family of unknown function (DUF5825)